MKCIRHLRLMPDLGDLFIISALSLINSVQKTAGREGEREKEKGNGEKAERERERETGCVCCGKGKEWRPLRCLKGEIWELKWQKRDLFFLSQV